VVVRALPFGVGAGFFIADDTITIGDGTFWNISSPISIRATDPFFGTQAGHAVINLDDSNDTIGLAYTMFGELLPGPGPRMNVQVSNPFAQRISWFVGGIEAVNIMGGRGGNSFDVQSIYSRPESAGPTTITINAGAGKDTVNVKSAGDGHLYVNGQAGDDTFKTAPIGYAVGPINPGPDPSQILANVHFDGGGDNDVLTIQGPLAGSGDRPSTPVVLLPGTASHDGITIFFTAVKLQVQNGAFFVNGDLGPIALAVTSEASAATFESATDVTITVSQNLRLLEILSGPVTVAPGAGALLRTAALSITGGYLDLTDNALEIAYPTGISPFPQVKNWLNTGQIHSSNTDARHALGYADGGTVRVRFTLRGDANLDRRVDFTDLIALAQHYNQPPSSDNWVQGDFNNDQAVDLIDLILLARNYGASLPASAVFSTVLVKPASVGAVAAAPVKAESGRQGMREPVRKLPSRRG
jgi:hypothetical protein